MKSLTNMDRITLTTDLVMSMIKLYQFKGKDFYYEDIMNSDMEYIIKQTIERETFFFSRFMGLPISDNRMRLIIKKDAVPKNNDEKILSNIKRIFQIIHDNVKDFDLIPNEIANLAKELFKDVKTIQFGYDIVDIQINLIRDKKKESKRVKLEELLNLYIKMLDSKEYELTQLITNFYIDFINMKVLTTDNEYIGLLLLYTFLFRERFYLFRYVSFFELLLEEHEAFTKGILQANFNWEDGYSQTTPLNRIIIRMMLKGYDKIELMIRNYEYDRQLNKSDNIENTIMKLGEIFTKDELRAKHPYTSESTINRTLQRLRDENRIRPNGKGRSATWVRLVNAEKFNPNFKQLDLFELYDNDEE